MSQVHVHLSYWHPASSILEYIPWIKDYSEEPIRAEGGVYALPQMPEAGTTPLPSSFEAFSQSA